ncbi:MAG: hypothetical protein KBG29_08230 [Pseudomonadales bacterium]|jgi:hypothetical protein|nr:hypothetical protein [Pseudomonadales bacterium]
MVNKQTSRPVAQRPQQGGARSDKSGRPPRVDGAGMNPGFYRPRFKVALPEGEAGFVPGYN